mgnify:CR=1 FL=1
MLRKFGFLALTLGLFAAPLSAEEHSVLLMGQGYFPSQVYPMIGDTVLFEKMARTPTHSVPSRSSVLQHEVR